MNAYTLIIDENVSDVLAFDFKSFLEKDNIHTEKIVYISKEYPGLPDDRIIIHLLNKNTIMLTSDRPFHNKILEKGLLSYYYNGDSFYPGRIKGMKTIERVHKKDLVLDDSYLPAPMENRSIVMCLPERQLIKMRTKRRRIRRYFGGLDHMSEAAVTISLIPKGQGIIIGIKIKISSSIGIKALDASQNYFEEKHPAYPAGELALCYGLMLLLQLMLHQVKTTVYYDTNYISDIFENSGEEITGFWNWLMKSFDNIEFIPTYKGYNLEWLRKKLAALKSKGSNEILKGYFGKAMENFRSMLDDAV